MYFIERLIDRPLLVFFGAIFILLLSLFGLHKLAIEENPHLTIPFIFVQVHYPGAAAEEVESQVLRKLEEKIDSIANIENLFSIAAEGNARLFVEFYYGIDSRDALRDVQDKVDSARREFPKEAEEPIISELAIDNIPIILLTLSGSTDLFHLKEAAKDIKPVIEGIPGVSEAIIFGGLERELHVELDPLKTSNYGITYAQISNAIKQQNMNYPGGHIERDNNEYLIRTVGKFEGVNEIGETIIYSKDNKLLRLSDIAEIKDSHKKIATISRVNGKDCVTIVVRKQSEINTLQTIQMIKEKINSISSTIPYDIQFSFSHDKSRDILRLLRQLGSNAYYGGALVLFILFLTMGLRNSILISMAIPFSLLITLLFLWLFNMTLSGIALFGMILILGMVVDGAIIVGENIYQKFEEGFDGIQAAKKGLIEVAWPVFTSTATTIAAFLPMFLVSGLSGQYLSVIPKVAIFALSGSMLVDHIILPTVAARVMKTKKRPSAIGISTNNKQPAASNLQSATRFIQMLFVRLTLIQSAILRFFSAIRAFYSIILAYSLKHRKSVLLYTSISVIISVVLIVTGILGIEFFPKVDVDNFSINFETRPGTSIEKTTEVARRLEGYLEDVPEIINYITTIGNTQALNTDIREGGNEGPEYGKIYVELSEAYTRRRTQTEILEEIKSRVGEIPGVKLTYFELKEGPPTGADIAIKISGNDLVELQRLSDKIQTKLLSTPGAYNVRSDFRYGRPELKIDVDREKASLFGVDSSGISAAVSTAFLGQVATNMIIDDEEVDIRIQNKKRFKQNIEDIQNIWLPGINNAIVPVGEIANIVFESGISDIRRWNRKRTITVRADVLKGFSTDAVKKNVAREMGKEAMPHDYTIVYGGESEDRDRAFKELLYSMIIAIALIFLILVIQFNSFKQTCMILLTIPLSFVGVVLGLVVTGNNFGFMAFVGVVALTGIVVNDAIVLVSYTNQLIKEGKGVMQAVQEAGQRRLRPVLMTTITTIGGLLPLALNLGGGGDFWAPMGWSIIFGISVATILTLVILPIVYSILETIAKRHKG